MVCRWKIIHLTHVPGFGWTSEISKRQWSGLGICKNGKLSYSKSSRFYPVLIYTKVEKDVLFFKKKDKEWKIDWACQSSRHRTSFQHLQLSIWHWSQTGTYSIKLYHIKVSNKARNSCNWAMRKDFILKQSFRYFWRRSWSNTNRNSAQKKLYC